MSYLLDTNVLSELRKANRCHRRVFEWAQSTVNDQHYISVLSLGEIRKGIERLPSSQKEKRYILESWLQHLEQRYVENILPVTKEISDFWGRLEAKRNHPVIDGLLATTAQVHGLTLVTRNVKDFEGIEVTLMNPFES